MFVNTETPSKTLMERVLEHMPTRGLTQVEGLYECDDSLHSDVQRVHTCNSMGDGCIRCSRKLESRARKK